MPVPVHLMPLDDEREHIDDAMCPCMPSVMEGEDPADAVVIRHNSYDGREIGEVCRKALDLMGCAIADEAHVWTDEERDAYEHAVALLNMHYPPGDCEPEMEGI